MDYSELYKKSKNIPICVFLQRLHMTPEYVDLSKNEAWYKSPFRPEKEPSFKVHTGKNVWIDFGLGETFGSKQKKGGDLIDLIKMLNPGIKDHGALSIIHNFNLTPSSFSFCGNSEPYESNITIKHIQPLQNRALVQYMESRKISPGLAARYVKEVYYYTYHEQIKAYFALCFENDKGGFELRNGHKTKRFPDGFKGSTTPKAITTIPGSTYPKTANIFEGFFDFLSALEYFNVTRTACTTIILNSTANLSHIINTLVQYQKINLFLDNDPAGRQATKNIKSIHHQVNDYSQIIYPDHKDFNEYLCSQVLFK